MQAAVKRRNMKLRHFRSRKKLIGTEERPRLNVRRSHLHLYAQAVDDFSERTLCAASTLSAEFKKKKKKQWGNLDGAKEFGVHLAEQLKKKKIQRIVFDRGGRSYQGRLRVLADTLRKSGIEF